ncbi:MAG TPA: ABC transporter ATP-binding protein [Actinomycetota bacterium]|nr:ABC transporter ATP-binding protein [Actinomycetota bacterium]
MTGMAIELEGLSIVFGRDVVMQDLDLRVEEGEFLCLLGPSGCGKSTLLRILGGLAKADGRVRVLGEPPQSSWQHLAYVFQTPRLVRWRNAMDNVALGLELRGIPGTRKEHRASAEAYLAQLGLEDLAGRPAHVLSGGEQQRVAIARALAVQPRILLMDEPFSALDVHTRGQLRAEIVSIWQKSGLTIVFVTHDIDEAVTIGSKVAVLSSKPTRLLSLLPIELSHPRSRSSPEFVRYRSRIVEHFGGKTVLDEAPAVSS